MQGILKNDKLELIMDFPGENYRSSRFDGSGKIVDVLYKGISIGMTEHKDGANLNVAGRGFYNEFGMDSPPGFEETELGGWFHKIGVGLMRKDSQRYDFMKPYEITPLEFYKELNESSIAISAASPEVNGYAYHLKKIIELLPSGFRIKYQVRNTGTKRIIQEEYVHNFLAINRSRIGPEYVLEFPFTLDPKGFNEFVNPEQKVHFNDNKLSFSDNTKSEFFISNLNGKSEVSAQWTLINREYNIGIKEKASFSSKKVNLWGAGHVISPELFHQFSLEPGKTEEWSRTYSIFELQ